MQRMNEATKYMIQSNYYEENTYSYFIQLIVWQIG